MTISKKQTAAKPSQLMCSLGAKRKDAIYRQREPICTAWVFEKSESTPNKPISSTHAKPVKAMADMNKARSEKAIYG